MSMGTRVIGTPVNRVDGRQKVTGTAQYAAEMVLGDMTFAVMVGSQVTGGHIAKIGTERALAAPGVLKVITHENRGSLGKLPSGLMEGGGTVSGRPPLENNDVFHNGQFIALVVAESLEGARYAASLLDVKYDRDSFAVGLEDAVKTKYSPEKDQMGEPMNFERGDIEGALEKAEVKLDVAYSTPNEHPCAMEPHASVASWSGDKLTVYNATQWVSGDRTVLAAALQIPPDNVRVLCPFTGGMFGSKALTGAHTILAAIAARELKRPVKVVLSREQVLTAIGHRAETVQRLEMGASRDGKIQGLRHHVTSHTSINDEFAEPASITSRMLYDTGTYGTAYDLVRMNVVQPSWMRAPGEAPGQYALESAMDELAYALNMDPVELRVKNETATNQQLGKPFSSRHLVECYHQGMERFGWNKRTKEPRSMKDGKTLVGWGMASATYPGYLMGAEVKVRLERDGSDVQAIVSTAGSDVGTGMYTMLAMTVADGLGLPVEQVKVLLGDSQLVNCAVAGGSNLTASTAPAATDACTEIKKEMLRLAAQAADGFTGAEGKQDEFLFQDGRIAHESNPELSIRYRDLLALQGLDGMDAQGGTTPIFGHNEEFAFQSFGAHFVEVKVNEEIGRVKVSKIASVFDCGKIMNPKGARSQFMGGVVFGLGAALLEELTFDRTHGQPINADLAGYLVPVHADVPEIDISWVDHPDYHFNSMGCRGVGEIGITGVAAAIANAVYHATGVRVRDLPITPDKLIH